MFPYYVKKDISLLSFVTTQHGHILTAIHHHSGGKDMKLSRREFVKLTGALGATLALTELGFDMKTVKASTKEFKLKGSKEFTSICTFCSVGCGMICHVKDGKLINLEGDPDHIINEGALCSKGASMSVLPNSDQRVKTPLYRAPGSDRWQEISWEEAIERIAKKIKQVRDENWIEKDVDGDKEYPANRTEALDSLAAPKTTTKKHTPLLKWPVH